MDREDTIAKETRSSKLPLLVQEKIIAELSELVYTLTDRLAPVLTPLGEDESMKTIGDRAKTVQSPIADQLDSNNTNLAKINNKISSLLERLEC